ncbi:hypothetical protein DFH27DRAFT_291633 [Peziza echinospora]|nr:hypothetical protein DFH27DRAFT_291633 [Peziza echinospora]
MLADTEVANVKRLLPILGCQHCVEAPLSQIDDDKLRNTWGPLFAKGCVRFFVFLYCIVVATYLFFLSIFLLFFALYCRGHLSFLGKPRNCLSYFPIWNQKPRVTVPCSRNESHMATLYKLPPPACCYSSNSGAAFDSKSQILRTGCSRAQNYFIEWLGPPI